MDFVIHRHGEIALVFGLAALAVWWLARRREADPMLRRALTALCVLIALQGVVGLDQYETHLPTELVWVHVGLASLTWMAVLWAACAAGAGRPLGGACTGAPTALRGRESRPEPALEGAQSPEIRGSIEPKSTVERVVVLSSG